MSKIARGLLGELVQTCPMLFVTEQEVVHTYASWNPSVLRVTMILVSGVVGDHATSTSQIGLPAVDCAVSPLQAEPSHVLVLGIFTPPPEVDLYPMCASGVT